MYHSFSESEVAYLWSRGIPALACLDDSWLGNFRSPCGQPESDKWLAAAEATHVDMVAKFMCGNFSSVEKRCDLRPARFQQYLGMLCDSEIATFRVPKEELGKLQQLLPTTLAEGELSLRKLECIARKCMGLTVAVRPASLWTHAILVVPSKLENTHTSRIDLARKSHADLPGEAVDVHYIYLARRALAKGTTLHSCSDRRGDGCIFRRVRRCGQHECGPLPRWGGVSTALTISAQQNQGDVRVAPCVAAVFVRGTSRPYDTPKCSSAPITSR